jgi:hypothetical protein
MCDSVYHCCGETNGNSYEKLQRRAACIVCKSKDSDNAMDSQKSETIQSRREHHTCNLVGKCIDGNCPQFFNNYLSVLLKVVICFISLWLQPLVIALI